MKTFRHLSIYLSAIFGIFAPAETFSEEIERESSTYFIVENDFGFTDRYYTNGMKFAYLDPACDWLIDALQFKALKYLNSDPDAQATQTLAIGQDMYVSYTINDVNPPMTDRPYAGWLYLSTGAHIASKNSLDSISVSIGIVGKYSGAELFQKEYHKIIHAKKPRGWSTQLKDEPAFVISFNHSERLFEYALSGNFRTDFICSAGANLGTVATEGVVKALWRFGFNMPYSFDAARIDFANSQSVEYATADRPDWHAYLFAGVVGKAVGYNMFLDGNVLRKYGRHVDKEWAVGEFNCGASVRWGNFYINYSWCVRSDEYKTQRGGAQIFSALMLGGLF